MLRRTLAASLFALAACSQAHAAIVDVSSLTGSNKSITIPVIFDTTFFADDFKFIDSTKDGLWAPPLFVSVEDAHNVRHVEIEGPWPGQLRNATPPGGKFVLAGAQGSRFGFLAEEKGFGVARFNFRVTLTPVPAALPLGLGAFAALGGLAAWTRRRSA